MSTPRLHRGILLAIAGLTVISGLIQAIAPRFVLGVVRAEATTPAAAHFFAIVGMFMVLFGGLLGQALLAPTPQPIAVLWAALQKLGAATAVTLGLVHAVFTAPLAWGVAGFDLLSGVLALWYWQRLRASASAP